MDVKQIEAAPQVNRSKVRASPKSGGLCAFEHMLICERDDLIMGGGQVRLYRLPNGYGLNGINTPRAYRFAFAWEFTVLEPDPEDALGFGDVAFDTPLTTSVKVCRTEEDAVEFLGEAIAWANRDAKS